MQEEEEKGRTRKGGYRGGFARSTSARGQVGCETRRGRANQAKGERKREREREKEIDREGERRKSAPNMQQEKKNWRSIGSSW